MYSNQAKPVFRIVTSAGEAEEHLRVIRQAMERSTRHSTLSGLSGVVVGLLALAGCLLTQNVVKSVATVTEAWKFLFLGVWGAVFLLSLATDILLTKRRAARVGKTAFSPLGKHLTRAAAPGLFAALAFSLFYVRFPELLGTYIYGAWMLCYAVSLLSVGMFSVREVSWLGWAFLLAGALTLLIPQGWWIGPRAMMAVTFGGFHILYGLWMGYKYGW
ncbi:MAG: hypothetical protein H7Z41_12980 [Cytophagales bacterium]|nr:hypothetical protein [Armatimonadota bacterium]